MLIGVLPDIAKAVAEPISSISDVKIIGSGSQGVSDISGNVDRNGTGDGNSQGSNRR